MTNFKEFGINEELLPYDDKKNMSNVKIKIDTTNLESGKINQIKASDLIMDNYFFKEEENKTYDMRIDVYEEKTSALRVDTKGEIKRKTEDNWMTVELYSGWIRIGEKLTTSDDYLIEIKYIRKADTTTNITCAIPEDGRIEIGFSFFSGEQILANECFTGNITYTYETKVVFKSKTPKVTITNDQDRAYDISSIAYITMGSPNNSRLKIKDYTPNKNNKNTINKGETTIGVLEFEQYLYFPIGTKFYLHQKGDYHGIVGIILESW